MTPTPNDEAPELRVRIVWEDEESERPVLRSPTGGLEPGGMAGPLLEVAAVMAEWVVNVGAVAAVTTALQGIIGNRADAVVVRAFTRNPKNGDDVRRMARSIARQSVQRYFDTKVKGKPVSESVQEDGTWRIQFLDPAKGERYEVTVQPRSWLRDARAVETIRTAVDDPKEPTS